MSEANKQQSKVKPKEATPVENAQAAVKAKIGLGTLMKMKTLGKKAANKTANQATPKNGLSGAGTPKGK